MARKIHCFKCGNVIADKAAAVPFHHYTGTRYFCRDCAAHEGGYTWENTDRQSKETAAGWTLSKEFEIPRAALAYIDGRETTAALEARGWIGTSDCTVWKEFKTPIYNGLQSYTKVSKSIEQITKVSEWKTNRDYGTHTNIGHRDLDRAAIDIIRTWRETLLQQLQNRMTDRENRALYGRTWTTYADRMNEYGNGWANDHGCFINLQHNTHIEYRMNKYQTAAQDNRATKYAIETTAALLDFAKIVKNNRATIAPDGLRAANRAAAEKTARRLVKIYDKWAAIATAATETPIRATAETAAAD